MASFLYISILSAGFQVNHCREEEGNWAELPPQHPPSQKTIPTDNCIHPPRFRVPSLTLIRAHVLPFFFLFVCESQSDAHPHKTEKRLLGKKTTATSISSTCRYLWQGAQVISRPSFSWHFACHLVTLSSAVADLWNRERADGPSLPPKEENGEMQVVGAGVSCLGDEAGQRCRGWR